MAGTHHGTTPGTAGILPITTTATPAGTTGDGDGLTTDGTTDGTTHHTTEADITADISQHRHAHTQRQAATSDNAPPPTTAESQATELATAA